jgi:hypothetical protein
VGVVENNGEARYGSNMALVFNSRQALGQFLHEETFRKILEVLI